jgi:hypothetical protein
LFQLCPRQETPICGRGGRERRQQWALILHIIHIAFYTIYQSKNTPLQKLTTRFGTPHEFFKTLYLRYNKKHTPLGFSIDVHIYSISKLKNILLLLRKSLCDHIAELHHIDVVPAPGTLILFIRLWFSISCLKYHTVWLARLVINKQMSKYGLQRFLLKL